MPNNNLWNKFNSFAFFRYSFSHEQDEFKPNYFQLLQLQVSKNFEILNRTNTELTFKTRQILNIPYTCKMVQMEQQNTAIKTTFTVKPQAFINVCLLVIVFAAFFSSFSLELYFWFSVLFLFLFYILNRILTFSLTSKLIKHILLQTQAEDFLSPEQQKWIQNPNLCSACGTELQKYDYACTECGLFIKNANNHRPHTSTEDIKTVRYIYKEDEKN